MFRWYLELAAEEAAFDHWTFSRKRARLLEHELAGECLRAVVAQARGRNLGSDEHFTLEGMLVAAWAALKSFQRPEAGPREPPAEPGKPTGNCHGARRRQASPQSTPAPAARLAPKGAGKEAQLCSSAHARVEHRPALWVDFQVASAAGDAERRAARARVDGTWPGSRRSTRGGDRAHDPHDCVTGGRGLGLTPHVAPHAARAGGSALAARPGRQPGYAISQGIRQPVEAACGWMKTIGGLRKTRSRGRARRQLHAYLVAAAYNLVRSARLAPVTT